MARTVDTAGSLHSMGTARPPRQCAEIEEAARRVRNQGPKPANKGDGEALTLLRGIIASDGPIHRKSGKSSRAVRREAGIRLLIHLAGGINHNLLCAATVRRMHSASLIHPTPHLVAATGAPTIHTIVLLLI